MPPGCVKISPQAAVKVNFSAKWRSAHFAKTYVPEGISPLRPRLRGCPPLLIPRKFAKDPTPFRRVKSCRDSDRPWSVPKLLVAVFRHGLMVVAALAQRLPVGCIPEQFLVSTMGDDVVNHRGPHQLALCLAPNTQRMGLEDGSAGFLPTASVALFGGGFSVARVEWSMFLTVHTAVGNQSTAARVLAGDVWTMWHGQPPPPMSSRFMIYTLLSYVRTRGKDRSRVRQSKRTQEAVASGSLQSLRV